MNYPTFKKIAKSPLTWLNAIFIFYAISQLLSMPGDGNMAEGVVMAYLIFLATIVVTINAAYLFTWSRKNPVDQHQKRNSPAKLIALAISTFIGLAALLFLVLMIWIYTSFRTS